MGLSSSPGAVVEPRRNGRGLRVWGRRALVAGVAAAIALVAAELVARVWLGPVVPGNATILPSSALLKTDIPGLRFVFRPGATIRAEFGSDPRGYFDPGATLTYRINSLGFRGPETTREKPAGVLRIAAVGDSVLFGSGVRDEHLLTTVLQETLAAGGHPCEVLDFGVPSYDGVEEAVFLRRIALDYQPDLAFVLFFLNDAKGGNVFEAFNERGEASPLRTLSRLYDHLASRIAQREALRQLIDDYQRSFANRSGPWREVQEELGRARAAAERRGVPLVLVIFPLLYRLDDGYPFVRVHEKVAQRARELGYHVLDLLPAFLGRDGLELWVHPDNQHPNEVAHDIAGRAIASFLSESGLLPTPAR